MKKLICSVLLLSILTMTFVAIPPRVVLGSEDIYISEDGILITGQVTATEISTYRKITLDILVSTSNSDNWVAGVGVYFSMWRLGHDDEAFTKTYLSPTPDTPGLEELLYPQGITPIGPSSDARHLIVSIKEEKNFNAHRGKVVLVVKGEYWLPYCYVANVDFTTTPIGIEYDEEATNTLRMQQWGLMVLDLPVNIADWLI